MLLDTISKREMKLVAPSHDIFVAYRFVHSAPCTSRVSDWSHAYKHTQQSIQIRPTPGALSLTEVRQH